MKRGFFSERPGKVRPRPGLTLLFLALIIFSSKYKVRPVAGLTFPGLRFFLERPWKFQRISL